MFRKRAEERKARRKEPDSPGVESQILHLIDCVTLSKCLHLSGSSFFTFLKGEQLTLPALAGVENGVPCLKELCRGIITHWGEKVLVMGEPLGAPISP